MRFRSLFFVAAFGICSNGFAKTAPVAVPPFINSSAVIFKTCSATGDNLTSEYNGENVTVQIRDSGIYVVRANKKVEPYFTPGHPCFEQAAKNTECDADELDAAVNPRAISHVSLTKKCHDNLEDSIPEANRSIPAHMDLIINYQTEANGDKSMANGTLSCVGLDNMNVAAGLNLSDCK